MTMNFDPEMNPVSMAGAAPAAPAQTPPTTEAKLGDLLLERERIAAQMVQLAANGSFGSEIIGLDDYGNPITDTSGDYKQLAALADTFDILGDLAKAQAGTGAAGDGGISASALAQLGMQERQLAESIRQFDIGEARQNREFADTMGFNREELGARTDYQNRSLAAQEKQAADQLREEQRRNNLSSTLDMLTNQIRIGDIGVAEASNRITAATQAANVQRDILADHAGKALPAGTTTFPNLGANGPIAAMAAALGQPFKPFETLGTFAIDPNAIAAPISSAPGNSVLPGINDAQMAAAQALASMGVPVKDAGGPVQGPYVSVAPEMHIPTGGNQAITIPLDRMRGIGQQVGGAPQWVSDEMVRFRGTGGGGMLPSTPSIQPVPGGTPFPVTMPGGGAGGTGGTWGDVWSNHPLAQKQQRAQQMIADFSARMQGGQPQTPPFVQMIMNALSRPPSGPYAPDFQQLIQQLFTGFGLTPNSTQGNSMRAPQMGGSSVSNAMAGG